MLVVFILKADPFLLGRALSFLKGQCADAITKFFSYLAKGRKNSKNLTPAHNSTINVNRNRLHS